METLVCNCLIPFCLIQEKEKESDTEARAARTARESLICDIRRWDWVTWSWIFQMMQLGTAIGGSSSIVFVFFFFLYCHRWDKSVRGFCCLCTHRWSVLWSQCPQSILHRTSDCLCKQNLRPKWSLSLNQRHCMKICSPVFRHGKGQPSTIPFAFFNSQCTSKDDAGRKKSGTVAKDFTVIPQFFFLLLWLFVSSS